MVTTLFLRVWRDEFEEALANGYYDIFTTSCWLCEQ